MDGFGQHVLSLVAERGDVSVGLEEVEELGGVGHPEGQDGGVTAVLLDGGEDSLADSVQHVGQPDGSLLGDQLRPGIVQTKKITI